MRVFTKILSIILSLIFVLSVALNIILGISSTTFSLFTNEKKAMKEIYFYSSSALSYSKAITIEASMPYSLSEGYTSKDIMTCEMDKESISKKYNCKMISKLYDEKSHLVRTSYFPGDGYKYTDNGEKQEKTEYSSTNLYNYFLSLNYGANLNLNYLLADSETIDTYSFSYKKGFSFDINTFSLDKKIDVSYYETKDKKSTIKMKFDANDRLYYLKDVSNNSVLKFKYELVDLGIPSLIGY